MNGILRRTSGLWNRFLVVVVTVLVLVTAVVDGQAVENCTQSVAEDYFGALSYGVPEDAFCRQLVGGEIAVFISQPISGIGPRDFDYGPVDTALAEVAGNLPEFYDGTGKRIVRDHGSECYFLGVPAVGSDVNGWFDSVTAAFDGLPGSCRVAESNYTYLENFTNYNLNLLIGIVMVLLGAAMYSLTTGGRRSLAWTDANRGVEMKVSKPAGYWGPNQSLVAQVLGAAVALWMLVSMVMMVLDRRLFGPSSRDNFYMACHVGGLISGVLMASRPYMRRSEPKYPKAADEKDQVHGLMQKFAILATLLFAVSTLACVWLMGQERDTFPLFLMPAMFFSTWAVLSFYVAPPRRPLPDNVVEGPPLAAQPRVQLVVANAPMMQVQGGGYPTGAYPPAGYAPQQQGFAPMAPAAPAPMNYEAAPPYSYADDLPSAKM